MPAARSAPAVVLPQVARALEHGVTTMTTDAAVERGLNSQGESDAPIYRAAAALLRARRARGVLVDVGCGIGRFLEYASDLDCRLHRCRRRAASRAVRRTRPSIAPIWTATRSRCRPRQPTSSRRSRTIEHLENPRAFCRELVRVLKPGGWLVLSTPNQLSAAEHPVPDCQRTIRGVPGRVLSGSPHRALASRSRPHRWRMRVCRRSSSGFSFAGRIPLTGRALSADAVARCFPRRFPTTWCSLPARMRDRRTVLGVVPRRLLIRRLPFGRYQMARRARPVRG